VTIWRLAMAIAALAFALLAPSASAHTASRSFSSWTVTGECIEGVVETDARRTTQLSGIVPGSDFSTLLANHAAATIRATQDSAPCAREGPTPQAAVTGQVRVAIAFVCPKPIADAPTGLGIRLFEGISPGHVHYVRVEGPVSREAVLSAASPTVALSGPQGPSSLFGSVISGAEHVLGGFDHLAFLTALALLAGSPWRVALASAGFTLGHSATLALVTLGVVTPIETGVEVLIAFTIAFAAAEAIGGKSTLLRAAIIAGATLILPLVAGALGYAPPPLPIYLGAAMFAFCAALLGSERARRGAALLAALFGLVHGAGFAGALGALSLPPDRIVPALFGFNVGVELGQLVALAILAAAAFLVTRLPAPARPWLRDGFAALLIALGVYWFAERTFVLA
jgi:hypothetical protein